MQLQFTIAHLMGLMLLCALVLGFWDDGSAFLLVAVVGAALVWRYRAAGLVVGVPLGWGIIHLSNMTTPWTERIDPVFAGLWLALGPAYMLAYCLPILCARYVVDLVGRRKTPSGARPHDMASSERVSLGEGHDR